MAKIVRKIVGITDGSYLIIRELKKACKAVASAKPVNNSHFLFNDMAFAQ